MDTAPSSGAESIMSALSSQRTIKRWNYMGGTVMGRNDMGTA